MFPLELKLHSPEQMQALPGIKGNSRLDEPPAPRNKGVLIKELSECGKTKNLPRGKQIHAEAIQCGYHSSINVATTLVRMYANCGRMGEAHKVFNTIEKPDLMLWNTLMLGYAVNGKGSRALDLYTIMRSQGFVPDPFTFVAALKACISLSGVQWSSNALERGKEIHTHIGCHLNLHVSCTLIDMYAKCGSMSDARKVFDDIETPDVVAWNTLILGYAENGDGAIALDLFARMRTQGCASNRITFNAALKACSFLALKQGENGKAECLEHGRFIHSQIGRYMDIFVKSSLVDMYAKCGSMVEAQEVFDSISNPDVVSWTALILGYADNGKGLTALNLFATMKSAGCLPNYVTYFAALKACGLLGALESGRKIHAEISREVQSNPILVTSLVDFYAKCGSLVEAREIFERHPNVRDLTTWNALLAGHSSLGDVKTSFELFERMKGLQPNEVTFLCMLNCCNHAGLVESAIEYFEAMSSKYGVAPNVKHYNCMVDILGRSNRLDGVLALLQTMPSRANSVTWMTVLGACRKCKNAELGRLAFQCLITLGETNASVYVLMAHIYGSKGMWEEQAILLRMNKNLKILQEPGETCWTNEVGTVFSFNGGETEQEDPSEVNISMHSYV